MSNCSKLYYSKNLNQCPCPQCKHKVNLLKMFRRLIVAATIVITTLSINCASGQAKFEYLCNRESHDHRNWGDCQTSTLGPADEFCCIDCSSLQKLNEAEICHNLTKTKFKLFTCCHSPPGQTRRITYCRICGCGQDKSECGDCSDKHHHDSI